MSQFFLQCGPLFCAAILAQQGKEIFFVSFHPRLVKRIHKAGVGYKKAGVMLGGIEPTEQATRDLFASIECERNDRLSATLDRINARWGKGAVCAGIVRLSDQSWRMKRDRLSQAYTTRLSDLLQVGELKREKSVARSPKDLVKQ